MTHTAELLPCPFCGGEANAFFHRDRGMGDSWHIECIAEECGCGTCHHEKRQLAVLAWNTRTDAQLRADRDALLEALEIVWAEAHKMRNASKLVGPYPRDGAATKIWQRSLYHAGKDLCEKLKPTRALISRIRGEGE